MKKKILTAMVVCTVALAAAGCSSKEQETTAAETTAAQETESGEAAEDGSEAADSETAQKFCKVSRFPAVIVNPDIRTCIKTQQKKGIGGQKTGSIFIQRGKTVSIPFGIDSPSFCIAAKIENAADRIKVHGIFIECLVQMSGPAVSGTDVRASLHEPAWQKGPDHHNRKMD